MSAHIDRLIQSGHIGHSLLINGPNDAARYLASKLLQSEQEHHPDLHILRPLGKAAIHPIERLHDLAREVSLAPYEAPYKVFLIFEAERMPPASSNALLKTLEEPTPHTFICLVTKNREAILPTILSRCRTLYLPRKPREHRPSSGLFLTHVERYTEMQAAITEITTSLEKEGKTLTQSLRKSRLTKDQTAKQKEQIEREIEGEAAMAFSHSIDALFEDLFLWYRDLHLLKDDGDIRHIYHQENITALEAWTRPLPPLTQVDKALRAARLSIQRFSKLTSVLETLFLKFA